MSKNNVNNVEEVEVKDVNETVEEQEVVEAEKKHIDILACLKVGGGLALCGLIGFAGFCLGGGFRSNSDSTESSVSTDVTTE